MKKNLLGLLFLAGCLLCPSSLPAAAINLNPLPATSGGDGPDQPITLFRHGPQYVALRVPPDWKAVGDAACVTFTRAGISQASVVWRLYTGKIKFDPDQKSVDFFLKLALTSAPASSTDIALKGEPAVGNLFGMPTREATITFNYFGNAFQRSIMIFEDKDGQQYSYVITAKADEFEAIQTGGSGFLRTWWNVTERELGEVHLTR